MARATWSEVESNDPLGRALSWALSRILPGPEETALLKVLLHRGTSARTAWTVLKRNVPDLPTLFRIDTGGRNRLAPLLLASLRENEIEADARLLTVLRTAYVREELRSRVYFEIAGEVLGELGKRGVPFTVLKGGALAPTVYAEPCLRHAHDLDILVYEGSITEAVDVLEGLGLLRARDLADGWGAACRHGSGLPVLLLSRLFRRRYYGLDLSRLRDDGREVTIGGSPAHIMSTAHNLVHALGHASYCPSRSTLLWSTDAWTILEAEDGVDWDKVLASTREAGLEIPVFAQLRYLRAELGAAIPREPLERCGQWAARKDPMRRDMALSGTRRSRGRPPGLSGWEAPGPKGRLEVLRWELFPSREYLRWVHGKNWRVSYPLLYLIRPITVMTDRLKWFLLSLLPIRKLLFRDPN
jgi:hypothetical protein